MLAQNGGFIFPEKPKQANKSGRDRAYMAGAFMNTSAEWERATVHEPLYYYYYYNNHY